MVKTLPANAEDPGFNPWVGKIPWRRKRQPTPVFWPGESHAQGSLVGCSPWGHKEFDMTEHAGGPVTPRHSASAQSIAKSFVSKFHTFQPPACNAEAVAVKRRLKKRNELLFFFFLFPKNKEVKEN